MEQDLQNQKNQGQTTAFYQTHLERVSRSFAFCIAELDSPLRHQIGLAYILCRIVDTIEDSPWETPQQQQAAFDWFLQSLSGKVTASSENLPAFTANLPAGEKQLLQDAGRFFGDFHRLEEGPRRILEKSISEMARGMAFFCQNKMAEGQLRLDSLTEINQYCFFVAGLVGELLTGVASLSTPGFDSSKENLLNAFHFGLYLQKINVLKDQLTDETEGRFFVFSRTDLKASLFVNAKHALKYILSLPEQARSYRIFCAWSFYLGLASLPWIDRSWREKKPLKISRAETWLMLREIKSRIDDNEFLIKKYEQLTRSQRQPSWYQNIYRGPLSLDDFESLGMA